MYVGHPHLCKRNIERSIVYTDINFGVDTMTLEIKLRTGPTGTIAFMALDLLCPEYREGKVEWLYRHDVEGTVWVIAAHAWLYDKNGVKVECPEVDAWFTADCDQCEATKSSFLRRPHIQDHHADIPDVFKLARSVLMYLYKDDHARMSSEGEPFPAAATKQSKQLGLSDDDIETHGAYQKFQDYVKLICKRANDLQITPDSEHGKSH
ncbi:hypothetical protein C8Q72DRAFT_810131 [Fomitopsis betulina]|nr:hypothetical protein C8Q72DRAFT_810013 [Fomitopsis betulina]KAI0734075.1 hypothetical protein C8Q72DRAFT_810131 [Fomitopsis betulina]